MLHSNIPQNDLTDFHGSKMLRCGDVAKVVGLHRVHISRMARNGEIPGAIARPGRHTYFRRIPKFFSWIKKRREKFLSRATRKLNSVGDDGRKNNIHQSPLLPELENEFDPKKFASWLALGKKFQGLSAGWDLGDWLNQGCALFDWEKDRERKEAVKKFLGTNDIRGSKRAMTVAIEFPAERRHAGLLFGHHDAVADLHLDRKKQNRLLRRAKMENINVSKFKKIVRKARAEFGPEKTHAPALPIFGVEKFFLDADVFLERNLPTVKQERDCLWHVARTLAERMAQVWPDKIFVKA